MKGKKNSLFNRFISLFLAMIMICSILPPVDVQAADGGTGGLKISAPSDNGTVNGLETVKIKWNKYSGAEHYYVVVKDMTANRNIVEEDEYTGTTYNIYSDDEVFTRQNGEYKIYVAAFADGAVMNNGSAWHAIYVDNELELDTPEFTSHSLSDTHNEDERLYVEWDPVDNADEYTVYVKKLNGSPDFGNNNESGTNISYSWEDDCEIEIPKSSLVAGKWYKVAMCAKNSDYNIESEWAFIYILVEATNYLDVTSFSDDLGPEKGSSGYFYIDSNLNWSISCDKSWLSWKETQTDGERSKITVTTTSANTSTSERTAKLTISASGVSNEYVTVTQSGKEADLPSFSNVKISDNITLGESITWSASVNGNGAKLQTVSVSLYSAQTGESIFFRNTNIGKDTYSLSGSVKTGGAVSGYDDSGNSKTMDLSKAGNYEVKIHAFSSASTNNYATTSATTVKVTAPEEVQLQTPDMDKTSIEVKAGELATISWDAVPDATTYNVYIWDAVGNKIKESIGQGGHSFSYIFETPGTYYAQVYALNGVSKNSEPGNVTIVVSEKEVVYATIDNFKISSDSIKIGESIKLSGTINGNGESIKAVAVSIYCDPEHKTGGYHTRVELSTGTYDLSKIPAIVAGGNIGDTEHKLEAGKSYDIEVFVSLSNGKGFKTNPTASFTVLSSDAKVVSVVPSTTTSSTQTEVSFKITANSYAKYGVEIFAKHNEGTEFSLAKVTDGKSSNGQYIYNYTHKFTDAGNKTIIAYPLDENGSPVKDAGAYASCALTITAGYKLSEFKVNDTFVNLGEDATITWDVSTAQEGKTVYYNVYIVKNGQSILVSPDNHSECSLTLSKDKVAEFGAGMYNVMVIAWADNHSQLQKDANITITDPNMKQLQTPQMAKSNVELTAGETATISWSAVADAKNYIAYIWDGNGNEVSRSEIQTSLSHSFVAEKAGYYYAEVYALSDVAKQSEPGKVTIIAKLPASQEQVAEEVNAKAHTIIVSEKTGNVNVTKPISGAKVTIAGKEYTTDANGKVETTTTGSNVVTVSAEGYRSVKESYTLSKGKTKIIMLEKEKTDGLPYVTLITGSSNNKKVDLRNQSLYFAKGVNTNLSLCIEADWNGHGTGTYEVIQVATGNIPGKTLRFPESNGGDSKVDAVLSPGNEFEPDAQIKLRLVAADGTKSEDISLNIKISANAIMENPSNVLKEGSSKINWLGNYPIRSDNEIFRKLLTMDMSISAELVPVKWIADYNDDGSITYKFLIGVVHGERTKGVLNSDENNSYFGHAWKELTDQIKAYKNAGNPRQYWKNLKNKYSDMWTPTKLEGLVDLKCDICGFYEYTTRNGKVIDRDGGIIIDGSAYATYGKTFFVGTFPLYYELKAGANVGADVGIDMYDEDDWTLKFEANNLKIAFPSISIEGGAGVRNVLTGGLKGTGELVIEFPGTEKKEMTIDLEFGASIRLYAVLIVDYEWNFAKTVIPFYPQTNTASMARYALERGNTSGPELSIVSRDYLNQTTSWQGAPASTFRLRAITPNVYNTLQEGVMSNAIPQLYKVGDKQIMLFVQDDADKTTGNHTQLVYSVYENGVWSEPAPVWESDTADFFFNGYVVDDQLVVAWQKAKATTNETDAEKLLTKTAENSEIAVAFWNEESKSFTNQRFITDDKLADMMPVVSTNGNDVVVTWVRNDANDFIGGSGNNQIYQAVVTENNTSAKQLVVSTEENIMEIAAADGQVVYITMNDEYTYDVYSVLKGSAEKIDTNSAAAGLTYTDNMFMWQDDGSINTLKPGTKDIVQLINGEEIPVSSSYEYVKNGNSVAVVWNDATENGYAVKASVLNGTSWSEPIILADGIEQTIGFMDAVLQDDGKFSVVANTALYDEAGDVSATSLQHILITPTTDVEMTFADVDKADYENGSQIINVSLENDGVVPVNKVHLKVYSDNRTFLDKDISVELLPGEKKSIEETLDVSGLTAVTNATVEVTVESDIDDTDNSQTVELGYVDVDLNVNVYEQGDQYLFVINAGNKSLTEANATLTITEDSADGKVLETKTFEKISNRKTAQYTYAVNRAEIDFADSDYKAYFFNITTKENDWNTVDNTSFYTIQKPNYSEVNLNGAMAVADVVKPERVEITNGNLIFNGTDSASVQLTANLLPTDSTAKGITWTADNNDIIHITSEGIVTPFREGTTTVTAEVTEGITDTITVTVTSGKEIIYGDATGDGQVNSKDVVRLRKYLAYYDYETGTSTEEISLSADATGDGQVNSKDVVRLRKYLADYDYETGTSTVVLGPNGQ